MGLVEDVVVGTKRHHGLGSGVHRRRGEKELVFTGMKVKVCCHQVVR